MAVDPDKPFNREEMYLAKAAGEGTTVPDEPWSRKEAYLEKISGRLDGIDEKIAALATDISLKGGVVDYAHLPADAEIGDAYITEDTGILYVWVGDEWTPLNMQGGESDIFVIERSKSGSHAVTTSYDDIVAAFNAGKLLVLKNYVSNDFNSEVVALGFGWKGSNIEGETIPDTGIFNINFFSWGSGSSSSHLCFNNTLLQLNVTNKTVSAGYVGITNLYPFTRSSHTSLLSSQTIVGITGNPANLTTTIKTNLVSAVNELVTNMGGAKIVVLTQTQYDNLQTKDPNTLYIIKAA